MSYDHYRIKYLETSRSIYYVSSLGYFEKFDKRKYPDCKIYENRIERLEGHIQRNCLRTHIGGKWIANRVVVYRYFTRNPSQGKYIMHKNGNIWDCNIENLRAVKMSKIPQDHIKRKGVSYTTTSGERCVLSSITELSKAIYMHRSSISRYLRGKSHSAYLDEIQLAYHTR